MHLWGARGTALPSGVRSPRSAGGPRLVVFSGGTVAGRAVTRGSRLVGVGLQVPEATKEEHRLGERIAHCGERLIFRSPNCECDPTARPLLVGANLRTHRMCHHCAKLRSRKLAARVHEMFGKLRAQGITGTRC